LPDFDRQAFVQSRGLKFETGKPRCSLTAPRR
jgi:hypothetical protein